MDYHQSLQVHVYMYLVSEKLCLHFLILELETYIHFIHVHTLYFHPLPCVSLPPPPSLQDSIERLEQELQVLRGSIDSQLRAPHTHTEGQGEREEREKTSGADNSLPSPPQLHLSVPPITLPVSIQCTCTCM